MKNLATIMQEESAYTIEEQIEAFDRSHSKAMKTVTYLSIGFALGGLAVFFGL